MSSSASGTDKTRIYFIIAMIIGLIIGKLIKKWEWD